MTASTEAKEPGLGWFVTGPLLAVAGTVLGTALASQRWADCAHGMDAPTRTGFVMIMPFAWIGMTLLLGLFQTVLVAVLPDQTEPEVKWVALFVAACVLTLLYSFGMGSPDVTPDGSCVR